ncbi:MAG: FAD-dependent oxidoreductase [Planctomycetaceae bacterium]
MSFVAGTVRGTLGRIIRVVACLVFLFATSLKPCPASEPGVLVYGATPGGIAAALAAAKAGQSVVLVESSARIGGLTTSGLSHTDFHSFESLTGSFLAFSQRVEVYYAAKYGADSPQVRDSFRGTFGEPKVNLEVFKQMLAEYPQIEVRQRLQLVDVLLRSPAQGAHGPGGIDAVEFKTEDGETVSMRAAVYIDATYEGDLMAIAGVPFRVGREGRDEYGEPLAPERADEQLQAYNFRFIMTRDPANRVEPVAPPGYRREDFVGVLPALESGRIERVFSYPSKCLFKAQTPPLPNGKYDINDVSGGLVRLSLPGVNRDWPTGDQATRQRIFAEQLRDQVGLLYFLQTDDAIPARYRDEAREWGWCRDEFTETNHLPPQLYVREARRMVGVHVFTQRDSEHAPGDARSVLHRDAIAMGDYGNNCHGTAHEGPRFGGRHTGEFYNPVPPYQIPYGVILPRELDNLLVPVAASSSHVGFCALRLEPIWMSLGQAAGHAAALSIETDAPVQDVPVPRLQQRLHADGSATIYLSDIPPGDPDFAAAQWWGLQGGWHALSPHPEQPGQRGARLHGQYYQANPGHAADLRQPLDDATLRRWQEIADRLGLKPPALAEVPEPTRGDMLRALWRQHSAAAEVAD